MKARLSLRLIVILVGVDMGAAASAQVQVLVNDQGKSIMIADRADAADEAQKQIARIGGTGWRVAWETNEKLCYSRFARRPPPKPNQAPQPTIWSFYTGPEYQETWNRGYNEQTKLPGLVTTEGRGCNRARFPLQDLRHLVDPEHRKKSP